MKKIVLIGLITTPFWVMAQKVVEVKNPGKPEVARKINTEMPVPSGTSTQHKKNNPSSSLAPQGANGINYPFVQVGASKYDLQTNASTGRRVMEYAGGKVSVTWTYSNENDPWNDRGTGYNHYNGTSWGSSPTVRIEGAGGTTNRTGWPNLNMIGSEEFVMGHTLNGGFRLSKNGSIGSNSWTLSPIILDDNTSFKPIWGRVANNGNTVHVVSNYSTETGAPAKRMGGVSNPTVYSRSLDGGATWPIKNILLPGYDSTYVTAGGGDNYAIDVKDSIVAIVIGGVGDNVALWKSTDNGNTFIMKYIDSMAFGRKDTFTNGNFRGNDGALDAIIDNNGKIHLFWGMARIVEKTNDTSISYIPGTAGLMHWDEYTNTTDTIAGMLDRNGTGALEVESSTWQFSTTATGAAARYGSTCLVTMPSAGVDASNNLYVVYSAPVEEDLTPLEPFENFRDQYVVFSTNNGATWSDPQNITKGQGWEDAFGSINKHITNKVHMIWQRDDQPGTELQNGDLPGTNMIMYAGIPTADILSNSIGGDIALSTKKINRNDVFSMSQNFPNPFHGNAVIDINMKKGAEVKFVITNMLGEVMLESTSNLEKGLNELTIDGSSFSAGIYFYTVEANGVKETRKMVIQ